MASVPTAKAGVQVLGRRIFISYARKDGDDAAHRLCELFNAAGCEVWLDRERIRGGASWSEEIEAALNRSEVLVAVLTPESYVSEICRAEQIWALDEGKIVIPVVAVVGAPVPLHLKGRNWRKFPEQQADLMADIAADRAAVVTIPRPLRYDTVPNLPQNHVRREKSLADLRDLVFTEGMGTNIAVTALSGMGGIGKTVLAISLCRDTVVQRAFPDGIAWITIGREWDRDFVSRMREVARSLGDDLSGYDNPLACENRYRTILREKAALVVVDDVWNLEDLKPLLVDAPRSRVLFTTRDAGIAKALTNRKYSADLLSKSEARNLLARWSGKSGDTLPPEAEQIIQACGELAAAVAQVGATLRDLSLDEWRDTLHALQTANVSAIEDRLPPGQQSFFRTLAVSLQAVPTPMQERYLKLAVLLEDVPASVMVLQTLWKVNEAEGRRTARYFVDRSLASWAAHTDPARGIRLHDLQLDYVRAHFADQAALQSIHGALRLSANVIARKPEEFASQMVGRLLQHQGVRTIAEFTKDVADGGSRPWLKSVWPSLHPPGTGLIRTLAGHLAPVRGVAVEPDGRRAVSASDDHTLKVWDLESGQELRELAGHAAAVLGVAVTSNWRLAVSASDDCTLKVWDLESGQQLHTLAGHSNTVLGVAATHDGRYAVSASGDHTLKVWDLETGQEVRTLSGHSNTIWGVSASADGRRAVSASYDHTLKVWDLESGRELQTLMGHSEAVWGVAVSEDGEGAVSASGDNTLKVWHLASGRAVRTLTGHSDAVWGVAVTADGCRAVSASNDQTVKVWDLASGQQIRTLAGHSSWVTAVAVTANGRRVISASGDKTLKVWDLESPQELPTAAYHSDVVRALAVTPDGRRAVSGSDDRTLKVWDLERGREVHSVVGHSNTIWGVAMTADGQRAVSASSNHSLKVWDLESGQELLTLSGHSSAVWDVAVTPDGRLAVSASRDHTLKIWDLESGQEMRTLAGHSASVSRVAVTADGRRAVSASSDNTLKVWNLENGEELHTLAGHSNTVWAVAVTADGRRAVSASDDHTLKVWDLESGQELRTLTGHSYAVRGVAVAADGRLAVSASDDNTLKVWNLDTGEVIAGFTCDGAARCCAFAGPKEILAGDGAGRLYFLSLETTRTR